MKTIVFKEPFESKLKELNIKTKFIHNIRKYRNLSLKFTDKIEKLNKQETFDYFITTAFYWDKTPEGVKYWDKIARL